MENVGKKKKDVEGGRRLFYPLLFSYRKEVRQKQNIVGKAAVGWGHW